MKVLIHACPARMWYVSEYLVPELTCQGVERIEIYNDARQLGNLRACIDSMERLRTDGDTWHLQDDVLPASDFAERAQALENFSGVICGFVNEVGGPNANLTGLQSALDMWYSFPCIRIPDCMARQFAAWAKAGGDGGTTARDLIRRNVGDDWFFRRFYESYYASTPILHCKPCLVQHVDHLLGGSLCSPWRGYYTPAAYWNEPEREAALKEWISARVNH